jgi:HEPN domain
MIACDAGAIGLSWEQNPHRLRSLPEMLEIFAVHYIELGRFVEQAMALLASAEDIDTGGPILESRPLSDDEKEELRDTMKIVLRECRALDLKASCTVIARRIDDDNLPEKYREFELLVEMVEAEIGAKKFFFIPDYRAKYYNLMLPIRVVDAFPAASSEIVAAGKAFATALYTSCVFHAMRAAEIGVRALAAEMDVTFPISIDLIEFGNVLDKIDGKIRDMRTLPRSEKKALDLQFLSQAASQFRYFKDGWRVRAAHARAIFDEREALSAFDHTLGFFETITAHGLKERA